MSLTKRMVVDVLLRLCDLLDSLPGLWRTDPGFRFVRRCQLGCTLGLSNHALDLEARWRYRPATTAQVATTPGTEPGDVTHVA